METAIQSTEQPNEFDEINSIAPACVLTRVRNKVLDLIQSGSSTILVTGETGKGKSAILKNIGKKVSATNRLVVFNGVDFLKETYQTINSDTTSNHSSEDTNAQEFNSVKDFIHESINLNENILILVDSADYLPADILDDLIMLTSQNASDNRINLVLAGLPKLEFQLNDEEKEYRNNLVHISLDELSKEDILSIATSKCYINKPITGEIHFSKNSLNEISEFINDDQKLLDVVLEWCSTIGNENSTSTITKNIAIKAIACLEDFANDSSVPANNAYPPSNTIEDFTGIEEERMQTNEHEIPILEEYLPDKSSNISTIKSHKSGETQDDALVVSDALEIASNVHNESTETRKIETETIPAHSAATSDRKLGSKKPLISLSFVIVLLVIGLILLITIRLQPNLLIKENRVAINNEPVVAKEEIQEKKNIAVDLGENDEIAHIDNSKISSAIEKDNNINKNDRASSEQPKSITVTQGKQNSEETNTDNKSEMASRNFTASYNKDLEYEAYPKKSDAIENVKLAPRSTVITKKQENLTPSKPELINQESATLNKNEIDKLLRKAEQQFANKHLTTPFEDSAYKSYKTILASDPNNKEAQKGIYMIHQTYVNWANYYLKRNQIERSELFFKRALVVNPNDQTSKNKLSGLRKQSSELDNSFEINNQNLTPSEISEVVQVYVSDLLIRAKLQLQNENLTTPPNNNAYETYLKVLSYQPDNHIAKSGISAIKQSYINLAEEHLKESDYRRATFYYEQALAIDPFDAQLTKQLKQAKQLRNSEITN